MTKKQYQGTNSADLNKLAGKGSDTFWHFVFLSNSLLTGIARTQSWQRCQAREQ
jgi:hypothetical protein